MEQSVIKRPVEPLMLGKFFVVVNQIDRNKAFTQEEQQRERAPLASPSTLHQVNNLIASWAIPIISLSVQVSVQSLRKIGTRGTR